ncbi:hypothetical protein SAMN03159341_10540 [Paenibacillus sp. 1_12]|nr:hypothetical protein SAMN03159341_10540 [Paenibacillus sp. 1_12]
MKHDVGGKVSITKTLMDRISVSFYCIDFLIALAVVSGSLIIKNLSQHIFGHSNLLRIFLQETLVLILFLFSGHEYGRRPEEAGRWI